MGVERNRAVISSTVLLLALFLSACSVSETQVGQTGERGRSRCITATPQNRDLVGYEWKCGCSNANAGTVNIYNLGTQIALANGLSDPDNRPTVVIFQNSTPETIQHNIKQLRNYKNRPDESGYPAVCIDSTPQGGTIFNSRRVAQIDRAVYAQHTFTQGKIKKGNIRSQQSKKPIRGSMRRV
ncbi:MAG: hypothetical protein WCO06_02585 [Candidatus Roizmanbacteria bacterium]